MSKIKSLDELIKTYNKDYIIVRKASDKVLQTVPRIGTGVFIFDYLTGGGVPLWKYTIFHGLKSSGKSTTALRVINGFLKAFSDKNVVLMDFEQSFDNVWASNFIDEECMDRLIVITPPTGEIGVNMCRDIVRTGEISLLVVDSLAAVVPSKMSEADAEDNFVGEQARLINKLLRSPLEVLNKARAEQQPISILLINQVRVNIGAGAFKSAYTKPCGVLQDFLASLDIKFYEGNYHKSGDIPVKVTHQFKIEKNKLSGALPKRTGEFTMYLVEADGFKVGQVDDAEVVLEYGKRDGIIRKTGSKWTIDGLQLSTPNQAELLELIRSNQEVYTHIKNSLILGLDSDS